MSFTFYVGQEYQEYAKKFQKIKEHILNNAVQYGLNPNDPYVNSNANIFRTMVDLLFKGINDKEGKKDIE